MSRAEEIIMMFPKRLGKKTAGGREVFGIEKTSVRLLIGVASLPMGMPIELDVIFEVAE
jgi:hypothetical protein